ncbi:hypothetical protein M9Y10_012342 [Tritrichomonas musculus]|uniref:PX domain-containing protein n=1 Tax=Tritrichomonas musculus TaxID=1915356 RepID=A0ABR2ID14_9EUKA
MRSIPLAQLPLKKASMLEKSATAGQKPPFYISVENAYKSVNPNKDSSMVYFYDIEIGLQFGKKVLINKITRRYSQIDRFNTLLKKSNVSDDMILHKLPPKKLHFVSSPLKKKRSGFHFLYEFSQLWSLDFSNNQNSNQNGMKKSPSYPTERSPSSSSDIVLNKDSNNVSSDAEIQEKKFISERQAGLQKYFESLSLIPGIVVLECFQVFFGIDSLAENQNKNDHESSPNASTNLSIEKTRQYMNLM